MVFFVVVQIHLNRIYHRNVAWIWCLVMVAPASIEIHCQTYPDKEYHREWRAPTSGFRTTRRLILWRIFPSAALQEPATWRVGFPSALKKLFLEIFHWISKQLFERTTGPTFPSSTKWSDRHSWRARPTSAIFTTFSSTRIMLRAAKSPCTICQSFLNDHRWT